MKRIVLSFTIMIALGTAAAAQTSGSNSSNSTSVSSSREQTQGTKKATGKKAQADTGLNNRDMYQWKDGQRATPTGHEATGTNGAHATLPKDSATAQSDSTRQ
jgi:hypothetical protein